MIYLFTGQPGHGKSALALVRALEAKKKGRTVYAHGVKDLDYEATGFKPFPENDPSKWRELCDEKPLFLLDECYTHFPSRNPGAKVPQHVQDLATHRHLGVDFIMVCQQSVQVDPFIRGLIEDHVHVRRSKWSSKIKLRQWDQFQSNIKGPCSDERIWMKPASVHQYYTSTVLDTTEKRIPTWMKYTGALVVFIAVVLVYMKHRVETRIDESRTRIETARAAVSPRAGQGASAAPITPDATDEEWLQRYKPRIRSLPISAPIFDDRQAVSVPVITCASSGAGLDALGNLKAASCTCFTEQGTPWSVPALQCETMARYGRPYDHFKEARQEPSVARAATPPVPEPGPPPTAGIAGSIAPGQVASYGGFRQ